jgi:hypothetical protein
MEGGEEIEGELSLAPFVAYIEDIQEIALRRVQRGQSFTDTGWVR